MFIDKIQISVKAGNGGNGCVSFRREKYIAHGGPDGGDGGNGGSIVFQIDAGANTLLFFRYKRKFAAEAGGDGAGSKFHGKNGADTVIPVPPGTIVRDAATGHILRDMSSGEPFTVCRGGRGGWGNRHFATPTRQVPNFAKNGLPGEERELTLELKMIADVGLVGLPSAGKSSLLAAVSAARPKVAAYHFTTLEPSLGVVSTGEGHGFVMADIPGLIEGAAEGLGLGHAFLRHIERCRLLVQVIDVSDTEGRMAADDFNAIDGELLKFSAELAGRPRILVANKCDLLAPDMESESLATLRRLAEERGYELVEISTATRQGLDALLRLIQQKLSELPPILVYEPEVTAEEEEALTEDGACDVTIRRADDGAYVCEGKWLDLLVNRVNFSDRESMMYFERSLSKGGIIDKLREAGCEEGNTVRVCDIEFDFVE